MRKNFYSAIATVLCFTALFQSALSQNGSPYWSLAGNSNASGASKLGTTNSTPLRLFTNNVERLRIDPSGNIGVGITSPIGKFSIRGSGGTPAGSWVTAGAPIFTGFGESTVGNGDFILSMASNTANARGVLLLRRARGTLASPAAVSNNDYLGSLLGSGYDGNSFQNPATIDLYVDGTPSSGNVPARISLVTGSNSGNRTERLVVKSNGNVGIGTNSPSSRLHIDGTDPYTTALRVDNGGVRVVLPWSTGDSHYGIYSEAGIGVYGSGMTGIEGSGMTGVYGSGYTGVVGSGSTGVTGYGEEGGTGVEGYSNDGTGVYGSSYTSYGGNFDSYDGWALRASTTNGFYAGVFYGNVWTSGSYITSDKNLKQNIQEFSSAMSILNKLKPRHYEYKRDGQYAFLNLARGSHYGLLAQDVEEVLPNLVSTTAHQVMKPAEPRKLIKSGTHGVAQQPAPKEKSESISLKAVNYSELIPIMIKGMQEQSELIQQQQEQINELKEQISQLKGGSVTAVTGMGSLGRATPNPVRNSTRISYSLSSANSRAQLLLTDATGKTVKAISLNGSGFVNLDVTGLSSGIYNYSLLVNGKIAESRKMEVVRNK